MKYIDIHAHVNFAAFDADREEVIKRALGAEVAMINVGTQLDTSKSAVALAEKYEWGVFATVGLHPVHSSKSFHDKSELGEGGKEFTSRGEVFDYEAYKNLALHPKVLAIGECGLDYFRLEAETKERQRKVFGGQIDLANEVGKPLMLHIRNAYRDSYEILKSRAKVKGNVHFFAGTIEEARLFLDLGFSFSFTGVITFAREYADVVKFLPPDRIMSETDCPYITPMPHRGKRNEPLYVREVVKKIALIRGENEDTVAKQLVENALKFFDIPRF